MSYKLLTFFLRGKQHVIDLSPFTDFNTLGYAESLRKANDVYLELLHHLPELESEVGKLRGTLFSHYLDSDAKGARGKSESHFDATVLSVNDEFQELNKAAEKVKRLLKEGVPTVLAPNMRGWNDTMKQGSRTSGSMEQAADRESHSRPFQNGDVPMTPPSGGLPPSVHAAQLQGR